MGEEYIVRLKEMEQMNSVLLKEETFQTGTGPRNDAERSLIEAAVTADEPVVAWHFHECRAAEPSYRFSFERTEWSVICRLPHWLLQKIIMID